MSKLRLMMTLALLVTLPLALGCGGEPAPEPSDEPTAAAPPPPAAGSGKIQGTVSYENGDPDAKISMDADPVCAGLHEGEVFTEKVVAGEGGGLANVFVYVKSGLEGKSFPIPAEAHLLDQIACQYKPHVSGMMVGQKLVIRNSDPTLHNVHALPTKNAEFNQGQPFQGMELERTWDQAEVMVRFKCDVHPWMASYMAVLEHPFYAVTGVDGSFSIDGVPAGTYTLEAWHEHLGPKTMEVTLEEDGTAEANWAYTGADAQAAAGM